MAWMDQVAKGFSGQDETITTKVGLVKQQDKQASPDMRTGNGIIYLVIHFFTVEQSTKSEIFHPFQQQV